jgi:hypothetical protein
MQLDHNSIIDYFRNLNAKATFFPEDSFFRMDLEEIFDAFRKGINYPALAVESPDIDLSDSSEQETVNKRMFAFHIYKKPETDRYQDVQDTLNLCESLGYKIIARMKKDSHDPNSIIYGSFKPKTVKANQVSKVFTEGLYGYRFTGEFSKSDPLVLDPADWEDLDSRC